MRYAKSVLALCSLTTPRVYIRKTIRPEIFTFHPLSSVSAIKETGTTTVSSNIDLR